MITLVNHKRRKRLRFCLADSVQSRQRRATRLCLHRNLSLVAPFFVTFRAATNFIPLFNHTRLFEIPSTFQTLTYPLSSPGRLNLHPATTWYLEGRLRSLWPEYPAPFCSTRVSYLNKEWSAVVFFKHTWVYWERRLATELSSRHLQSTCNGKYPTTFYATFNID